MPSVKKAKPQLAGDVEAIIREIGEKHFRQPPDGAFTVNDMMRHYPDAGKEAVRGRLERMLTCGELSAGIFNRKKYYWKA